jgi:tRNA (guanine9-N1)-methyltransferase
MCEEEDFLHSFDSIDISSEETNGTKTKEDKRSKSVRKIERFQRVLARRQQKRKDEHKRRRQVLKETPFQVIECKTFNICIDLSFCGMMSSKELSKTARQLGRVWGLQKKYAGLETTLFSAPNDFLEECNRVVSGFNKFNWRVLREEDDIELSEHMAGKEVVYLSPDAHLSPLLTLDDNCVYVLGGLVDESGMGSKTTEKANSLNCRCLRLPIQEFMEKGKEGTFNLMLTINQVVEALCRFAISSDWKSALSEVVPRRSGFTVVN